MSFLHGRYGILEKAGGQEVFQLPVKALGAIRKGFMLFNEVGRSVASSLTRFAVSKITFCPNLTV